MQDEYLINILDNYKTNVATKARRIQEHFKSLLLQWGQEWLHNVYIIGSVAQDTNTKGEYDFDIDFLVSLESDTPYKLSEIHDNLKKFLNKHGHKTKTRNISLNTIYKNVSIDFVPAIRRPDLGEGYHNVYSTKAKKLMPSSPKLHIALVKGSKRLEEIKLTKIWAKCHKVDLPGFYAALTVIEALKKAPKEHTEGYLSNNFTRILSYLSKEFRYAKFMDPANTKDCISDEIDQKERDKIAKAATKSMAEDDWRTVVW